MTSNKTFQQLEALDSEYLLGDSALDVWYQGIRETPISDFEDGDLARACRQQLYLSHVVPMAIECLRTNPLAGDMYDGELLVAMKSIPDEYWQADKQSAGMLATIVEDSHHLWEVEELTTDAEELGRKLLV